MVADRYEGKRLSRPNDLVLKSDGAIYFTDPRPANNPNTELPTAGVFLIKDGAVKMLLSDYRDRPTDWPFSRREDSLRKRYPAQADHAVMTSGRTTRWPTERVFIDMSGDKAPGNPGRHEGG